MVIAKLSRSCEDADKYLVLYCKPSMISEVISSLSEDSLFSTSVEFIKVVE